MTDIPRKDLTPESASPTDIAPLGTGPEKPSHERTAHEEYQGHPWGQIAADPEFQSLLLAKARFVVPATAFFILYYFALPVLVGWFPEAMAQEVWGPVNWAYLFALSQFFMAWAIALLYVVAATGWDRRVSNILGRFGR